MQLGPQRPRARAVAGRTLLRAIPRVVPGEIRSHPTSIRPTIRGRLQTLSGRGGRRDRTRTAAAAMGPVAANPRAVALIAASHRLGDRRVGGPTVDGRRDPDRRDPDRMVSVPTAADPTVARLGHVRMLTSALQTAPSEQATKAPGADVLVGAVALTTSVSTAAPRVPFKAPGIGTAAPGDRAMSETATVARDQAGHR